MTRVEQCKENKVLLSVGASCGVDFMVRCSHPLTKLNSLCKHFFGVSSVEACDNAKNAVSTAPG